MAIKKSQPIVKKTRDIVPKKKALELRSLPLNPKLELSNDVLFNMDNINDVPPEIRKHIHGNEVRGAASSLVYDLFKRKPRLSIDEILVSLWRLFEIKRDRAWVTSSTNTLKNLGLVRSIPGVKGEYEMIK